MLLIIAALTIVALLAFGLKRVGVITAPPPPAVEVVSTVS